MDKDEKKKEATAGEIAEIMAANMAANMKDPDKFWDEKERITDEARLKVLKNRKEREEKEKLSSLED